jgi:membrane associated rhomboid family serine protease
MMGLSTTMFIIIITGIVTYMGFNDHSLFEKYKFSVLGIQRGEYYRYITSAFLHADWTHFFVNMLTMYFFGDHIETWFGTQNYLIVYFGGILAGNYLSYYFNKQNAWYAAIGASAGVNAIIFLAITMEPMMRLYLYFFIPVYGFIFALGYLWYTTMGTQNQQSNIGHEAHLGGAIAGVASALLFDFNTAFMAHPLLTLLIIAALVGAYYYINGKRFLN